jgi:hypothetical protein
MYFVSTHSHVQGLHNAQLIRALCVARVFNSDSAADSFGVEEAALLYILQKLVDGYSC